MYYEKKLSANEIVNPPTADAAFEEIMLTLNTTYKGEDFSFIQDAFADFKKLFNGDYQGYGKCDTPYHDIIHSAEVLLAAIRILDGYHISRPDDIVPFRKMEILFVSALFHDSGFIPRETDSSDKGAKNLVDHEERGKEFAAEYLRSRKFSKKEAALSGKLIEATNLFSDIEDMKFDTDTDRLLANILGTADLAGQMAARTYLERLKYLYEEFKDAGLPVYSSEFDLICRTNEFYEKTVKKRFVQTFANVIKYAETHFRVRNNIDENVYIRSIENQLEYLENSVCKSPESYQEKLRRTDNSGTTS